MNGNEPVNLHDGTIKSVFIDYDARLVKIEVICYEEDNSSVKTNVLIIIKNVEKLAILSNMTILANLAKHFSNINDWDCDERGNIEIDLCGGSLSFLADEFQVS